MLPSERAATVPRQVGRYRIERPLGQGGMGTVYLAVREDDYRQQVALKLVSAGHESQEILARFTTERQILADLRHPGIAALLDGGADVDGRPFLVMEYVPGESIDRYCAHRALSVRERLDLFGQICNAVQFAHQNLVVHRDLKPSNILVTDDGTVRLLDFGIAKVLVPDVMQRPLATVPGRTPMTPAYASPEQILGLPITTACDVYGLGCLLYRLLSGQPPHQLDGLRHDEVVDVICHREPALPSVAARRGEPPWVDDRATVQTESGYGPATAVQPSQEPDEADRRRLGQRLRGDLDAIVMKALRKEPNHRYGSAAEMAEDIQRHQEGQPVRARIGTWRYRAGKYLRRNKLPLTVATLLTIATVVSSVLWQTAVRERLHAQKQQTRAERVTEFLESLFGFAHPDRTQGGAAPTVYDLLELGRQRLAEELVEEGEIRAELLGTLGSVYRDLGDLASAADLKREALDARRQSDPSDRPELAKDINNLASQLYTLGDYAGAEAGLREALAMRERLGQSDPELATTMFNLAATLAQRGQLDEAERMHRRCLRIYRRIEGPDGLKVAASLYSLATLEMRRERHERAEELLEQALAIRIERLGNEHTLVARLYNSRGRLHHAQGRLDDADTSYRTALRIRQSLLGDDHPSVAQTRKGLAALLLDRGDADGASDLIEAALETLRRTLPADSITIVDAERVLGDILLHQRQLDDAERYLTRSHERLQAVHGPEAPATRAALESLITLYDVWGRSKDAATYRILLADLPLL